jgi:hypothetical protein
MYKTRKPQRSLQVPASNPTLTCPTCKRVGALTITEACRRYQCRECTARDEGYGY